MNQSNDLTLISKVSSGDRSAFNELYDKYKRRILNYLHRMVNNRTLAEDLTQETFIKVYLNIDKYKPTGSFSSWVYAIARNLAKNEFRYTSNKKNISLETAITSDGNITLKDVIASKKFDTEEIINNN